MLSSTTTFGYHAVLGKAMGNRQEPGPVLTAGPSILVAEDDSALAELLRFNLDHKGYKTTVCVDGDEAGWMLRDTPPSLAILDWMLPARSGLKLCRDIRANPVTAAMPVLILTARTEVDDRLRGFEAGADDYLGKPFEMAELVSRVKALLRRAESHPVKTLLSVGAITLDPVQRKVHDGNRPVHLGPKEYGILECLMREPGKVYSREEILEAVWGPDSFIDFRTVDVNVNRLRHALRQDVGRTTIRTVRLGGYAIEIPSDS